MADPHLERMRAIVQSLPGTGEKYPWGDEPHFTVADKIFTGWGREADGGSSIGVKCSKELQSMLVTSDPRFSVAPYVGKHGWVTFKIGTEPDWNEVEALVVGSYLLIAPKKLAAQVGTRGGSQGELVEAPPAPAAKKKPAAAAKKKPAAAAKKKPAVAAKKKPVVKKAAAKKPVAKKPAVKAKAKPKKSAARRAGRR